ncbi:hypothetical protein CAL15_17255 [Bordetella genomosp. 13]|uniref:6-phosphogluconate dehydrogenase NADP-binding domain-containing protein n=1 Tax=Bordetella genomosp. 13 TaxID=463040 RepID=A0A1W6ZFD2_9BORD|nr:NAD(P)-binding domain-containing protein [Bordetella genomosp. 13]ARP95972.1 hypothetical protein CAL15_17255 [Bordetella genomosp. 13]
MIPARIGIIGMDEPGQRAARQLLAAQPDVVLTVYDRLDSRCEPFRGQATLAATADEVLRESDAVVLALPNEHEVDRALERYSDGCVAAAVAGKLIVDLSPLPESRARALALAVEAAGGRYARRDRAAAHDDPAMEAGLIRILRE